MYLYCMLMRFHYTVIYRCSELLQKYKQAPPKSPCLVLLSISGPVLTVVALLTARFSGGFFCVCSRQVCF